MDNYIVRLKNKLVCIYYDDTLVYRIYENNMWGRPKIVLNNVFGKFTAALSQGSINIYCYNRNGQAIRHTSQDLENWDSHMLQDIPENAAVVYPIKDSLIYCKDNTIFLHNREVGKCTRPAVLQLQNITDKHAVLFYQSINTESPAKNIGYTEVSEDNFSSFKSIHTTNYQILDTSFITTTMGIHALYIVKSLFSYQLVYKCKTKQEFDPPIVIFEGQKMESCLLSIINGEVYAFFRYKGQVFSSKKSGETFTKPQVYKYKICKEPTKAIYLSEDAMLSEEFFVNNVYVDSYNPWDIQILPEMYTGFYSFSFDDESKEKEQPIEPEKKVKAAEVVEDMQQPENDLQDQINYMTTVIEKYKSQKEENEQNLEAMRRQEEKYFEKIKNLTNRITVLEQELKKERKKQKDRGETADKGLSKTETEAETKPETKPETE